ncbi:MAG: AAA family ATPase [Thermoanaerobaculia bacterium]
MQAVLFIGIQASGKTTFYLQRFLSTHVRISLDMLKTRARERVLLDACLKAGQPFVVDNTNVTIERRAEYIGLAKAAGFRVIGYFFRTTVGDALRRNKQRAGKALVPAGGLFGTQKRLRPPVWNEGFDELYVVEIHPDNSFSVSEQPRGEAPPAAV